MSGSGVRIGMMKVIIKVVLVTTQKEHLVVLDMFIVVVAGSTSRDMREHLIATATPLVTEAAT